MVWDKVLGLNVFPRSVAQKEVAFYKRNMLPLGVPLDSRTHIGDADHSFFSASLADTKQDFETNVDPFYDYLNTTTSRTAMVDTYQTDDRSSSGFTARPVVGGVFIRMLTDQSVWRKWASVGPNSSSRWADLPKGPLITVVVPTAQKKSILWKYTFQHPTGNWQQPTFDDSSWPVGAGGFGSTGTPSVVIGTQWATDDIWLRRRFTMPPGRHKNLQFIAFYDEDADIYIDGVWAARGAGYVSHYATLPISPAARKLLKPGAVITIAVHAHQTTGGQGIDVGLANVLDRD